MTDTVEFDWDDIEEIHPAIRKNAVAIGGTRLEEGHLTELDRLGRDLGASNLARQNAARLATGYPDLVVVLESPSNLAEFVSFEEMVNKSPTLTQLDESLRLAFKGQRCVGNTIVLDRMPFRSEEIRQREPDDEKDTEAIIGFDAVLNELRPKVILVCQCTIGPPDEDPLVYYCSRMDLIGDIRYHVMGNGHPTILIPNFHPMHFTYQDKKHGRVLLEYLFDMTVVVAANALVGRRIIGFGFENLRSSALHRPIFTPDEEGIYVSYKHIYKKDVAPPELIQRLRELGLMEEEDNGDEADVARLLEEYKGTQTLLLTKRTQVLAIKADILKRFPIPAPPGIGSY